MFSENGGKRGHYKWMAGITIFLFLMGFSLQPVTALAATKVDIAKANSAGVSYNAFNALNVTSDGLIFNNSKTEVDTILGGKINGNANLTTGSAKVIVSEVTGTSASQLNGMIEVAGGRADLVIANSNGIVMDGVGFINTGRAVLTTGKAVFGGSGSLDSFRVTKGTITVQGNGIDDSNGVVDRLDLISRAVSVNAAVKAKELNVITGANSVKYKTLQATKISGTGTVPEVSIDVGALGGMYADKIRLVSTDKGVGVNSLGTLEAQNGDLTIDSGGKVVLGSYTTANAGNISIQADSMDLSGVQMNAGSAVTLNASAGDINNTGGSINAGTEFWITTPGAYINSESGSLSAGTDGVITASSIRNTNYGSINTGNDLDINISAGTGETSRCGGSNSSPSNTSNNTYVIDNTNGFISATRDLTITAAGTKSSTVSRCGKPAQVSSDTNGIKFFVNNQNGFISAGNDLTMIAKVGKDISGISSSKYVFDNSFGYISAGNDLNLTILGTKPDSSKCSSSSGSVNTIYAFNNTGGMVSADNDLSITAKDVSSSCGSSSSGNQYFVSNNTGSITAQGNAELTVQGVVITTKVKSTTHGATSKCGHHSNSCTFTTVTSSDTTIDNTGGTIDAAGNLAITTQGAVNNTGGTVSAQGNAKITAFSVTNDQGTISGTESVQIITKKKFDTEAGQVLTDGTLTITTA